MSLLIAAVGASAASKPDTGVYIVQLAAKPLASYTGGIDGLEPTSPRVTGAKLDANDPAVRRYSGYLHRNQTAALGRVGGALDLIHEYRTSFAGFAAELTEDQVQALRHAPEVARITPDYLQQVQQATGGGTGARLGLEGPNFLGLPEGLWRRLQREKGGAWGGHGVIVGVIDTGIYPEHPYFADHPSAGYLGDAYQPPRLWFGACEAGERFNTSHCNNKLIGARWYAEGFQQFADLHTKEFLSPRDGDGHGSHTASTAAGNYGVDPVIDGNDLGVDLTSGIAPRAYVAMYKACWTGENTTGCATSDLVEAIDDAVADGVDVINYSIGSPTPAIIGPDEAAFLFAADAGVFVATSGGNTGPGPRTIGSPTNVPWVTSVAASTLARTFEATARVRDASGTSPLEVTVRGASVTRALPESPIVDAANAALPHVPAAQVDLCGPGSLDPAKVAGKVVLCRRGIFARVEKSKEVLRAGGVGMILYNVTDAQELVTDNHWVPSVHVNRTAGDAVKAVIAAAANPVASLTAGRIAPAQPDVLAAFSSRGPQVAVPDIAKPDVTAPGVNILAAATPEPASPILKPGERFQSISGTSMSAPHVAGVGALLTQLHPTWSPARIKSALMTTANPNVFREDGKTPATPFDAGSGRIEPQRAADPGLVLDVGLIDYLRYLEFIDPNIVQGSLPPLTTTELNLPSISFSQFTGVETATRTFTSVDPTMATWHVRFEGLAGLVVDASPSLFRISPGQQQTVTFTLQRSSAAFDQYVSGAVVLTNRQDGRTVRLPITIQPRQLRVQRRVDVATTAASGSAPLPVRVGYTGPLSALGWGLASPQVSADQTIVTTTQNPVLTPGDPGSDHYPVTVPAGAQLLAGAISDADGGDQNTDLDLYLYRELANGAPGFQPADLVAQSAGSESDELIELPLPPADNYLFVVVGFATKQPHTVYDFTSWLTNDPSPDDPSNPPAITITGDPVNASVGQTVNLTLNWTGVTANGIYYGLGTFHNAAAPTPANMIGSTIIRIIKTGSTTTVVPLDTPVPTPVPTPAPEPSPAPAPLDKATPAAPPSSVVVTGPAPTTKPVQARTARVRLAVQKPRVVKGRMLTLTVRTPAAGTLQARVFKRGEPVARTGLVRLKAGVTRVAIPLKPVLRPGAYTAKLTVRAAGRRIVRSVAFRVR